jgi:hypothetical protein
MMPVRIPKTGHLIPPSVEYTLVVVATRAKDDNATQISVTFIPASDEEMRTESEWR